MWGKDVDELIPKRLVAGVVGTAAVCVIVMAIASALIGCAVV